jgi:hypothetical protein
MAEIIQFSKKKTTRELALEWCSEIFEEAVLDGITEGERFMAMVAPAMPMPFDEFKVNYATYALGLLEEMLPEGVDETHAREVIDQQREMMRATISHLTFKSYLLWRLYSPL